LTRRSEPRQIVNAWCLYDWANSAFATTILAAVLPVYFRKVSAVGLAGAGDNFATSVWGYTSAASMLLVAVLSLLLGPLADAGSSKKRFLAAFAAVGAVFSALLAVTGFGDWLETAAFFVLAEIGFAVGEVFYDAMLPHIAGPAEIDAVSSRGYAMGYVGGGILLAVNILMIRLLPQATPPGGGEAVPLLGMRLSFLSVGIWWGAFSIPLFRRVPETGGERRAPAGRNPFSVSVRRLRATFSGIRAYRPLFLFILAFWFYNDGIGTIIKMATAYGDEIGIGILDLVGALLLTQFIGIPCSLAFGRLAGRIGAKRAILLGLAAYTAITFGGFFMTRAVHFWILAAAVGVVQGGTQALSRSLFGSMVPRERSAEFFGFYNISGKFAGILGPAVFALVGQIGGSSRTGILSLAAFFVVGAILLVKVDVEEGRRTAQTVSSAGGGNGSAG
jgi:MFS transporter, UMF1 family